MLFFLGVQHLVGLTRRPTRGRGVVNGLLSHAIDSTAFRPHTPHTHSLLLSGMLARNSFDVFCGCLRFEFPAAVSAV